jgi:hypothetical protein
MATPYHNLLLAGKLAKASAHPAAQTAWQKTVSDFARSKKFK